MDNISDKENTIVFGVITSEVKVTGGALPDLFSILVIFISRKNFMLN